MFQTHSLRTATRLSQEESTVSVGLDIQLVLSEIWQGLEQVVDQQDFTERVRATLPQNYSVADFWRAFVLVARAQIEFEPAYTYVAARALLCSLYQDIFDLTTLAAPAQVSTLYEQAFPVYLRRGVEAGLLDPRLLDFDLAQIAPVLSAERDWLLTYPGLQTLYDRYFLQIN